MAGRGAAGQGRPGADPALADRIVDAVLDEIAVSGLAELSMDRVARRAGVSKTTVYTRWRTKDELVLAAYQRIGRVFPHIDTGSFAGDWQTLWSTYRTGAANRRYVVALAELIGAAATNAQLRVCLHDYQASWRAGIAGLLRRAVARGELPGDVDVPLVAEGIQAMLLWRAVIADLPVDDALRAQTERLVYDAPRRASDS